MLRFICTLLLLLVLSAPAHSAQEDELLSSDGPPEVISGLVTELPPGKIVVNRVLLGKPAEHRTFLITPETKIEGKLRLRARVTVGFRPSEEGDPIATRIIVRPQAPAPKKP